MPLPGVVLPERNVWHAARETGFVAPLSAKKRLDPMAKRRSSEPGTPTQPAPPAKPAAKSASTPQSRPRKTGRGTALRIKPSASDDEAANELLIVFGENVTAARMKAGLKQSELAAEISLTQQYLSRIEMGRQNVTLRTMVALARGTRPAADHHAATPRPQAIKTPTGRLALPLGVW